MKIYISVMKYYGCSSWSHRKGNIILMTFLSMVAQEIVILTTSGGAIDENFTIMTFRFGVYLLLSLLPERVVN